VGCLSSVVAIFFLIYKILELSETVTSKKNISSAHSSINESAHPSSPVRIFLIGMMGSGKSYWAERLKKKFKVPCYDLDALVEMMEERTIAEIFEEDGEEAFRNLETKMLRLFGEKKQFILSVGGGTPCFHDNMKWMNKNGTTIWLDEPANVLVERLINEKAHRPLIKEMADQQLESFLASKREERKEFYSQAKHVLSGAEVTDNCFKKIISEHA
jgi:shikimate kinase